MSRSMPFRWLPVALFLLAGTCVGGCQPKRAVGEPCRYDRECDNGFCLDLSVIDEACAGRVCTRGCRTESDCPPVAAEPRCERFGGRSFCRYGGWRERLCGR